MKRLIELAFAGAIAATLSSSVLAAAGRTPGTFAVSPSGAATYTIPIWTPPGPRGIQPSLSLVYNSQSGGGVMGPGWGVAGLSVISRCNRTYAQDGTSAAVNLVTNDALCLDGQRLRLTSSTNLGTYGLAGTTYDTEIAQFSKITAVGTAGNGAASFTVQTKAGLTLEYGNGGNSRVLANGTTTASAWMLNKVSDRSGNQMKITYRVPDANLVGSTVPDVISWTLTTSGASSFNYTLQFNYVGNNPQGTIIGYIAGTQFKNADLLANVTISSGATVVRKYVFTYTPSIATGDKRLTSVQECADSGATDCLPATTMTYRDGQAGTSTTATTVTSSATGSMTGIRDFNGDGFNDLTWQQGTAWWVSLGSASGFGTPFNTGASGSAVFGDVTGVGQDGILAKSGSTWFYYLFNGAGVAFANVNTGITYDTTANSFALADVNGDGLPDLIKQNFLSGSGITITSQLNTTRTSGYFSTTQNIYYSEPAAATSTPMFTPDSIGGPLRSFDFNGDGRQDVATLVQFCSDPPTCSFTFVQLELLTSNGSGFAGVTDVSPPTVSSFGATNWNNDGCTDVVMSTNVYISGCNGSTATTLSTSGTAVAAMDWDGDGRTDLITRSGSTFQVELSTGVGLAPPTSISVPFTGCSPFVLDVGGDRLDDLGCYASGTLKYFGHNSPGVVSDLLATLTDGYNNTYAVTYGATVANSYTKGSGATFPEHDTGKIPVLVTNLSQPTGTGTTFIQSYTYSGARRNIQGRGFEGFQTVTVSDDRTDSVKVTTTRNMLFPFTGVVATQDVFQHGSTTTISHTVNTTSKLDIDTTANNQRIFPFVNSTTDTVNEVGGILNNTLITTRATTYSYDGYGNATNVSTTLTDSQASSIYAGQVYTATIDTTFAAADIGPNWCVNLPNHVTVTKTAPGSTIVRNADLVADPLPAMCRVKTRITEPASGTYKVTETLGFDAFGNASSVDVTGVGMVTRSSSVGWGTTGQFPMNETNALMHSTQYGYDFNKGVLTTVTDPNNAVTTLTYDTFARLTGEKHTAAAGTLWVSEKTRSYNNCTSLSVGCINANNRLTTIDSVLTSAGAVQSDVSTYLDMFDRPIATSQRLLSGAYNRIQRQYDGLGRVAQESEPCAPFATCTLYWTTNTYDALNRITQIQRPISEANATLQTTTMQYAGRTITTTDAEGKQSTHTFTVAGTLGQSQDHDGAYQSSVYDAFGSLLTVSDSLLGTLFTATYDYGVSAFQRDVVDMDLDLSSAAGQHRHYNYNALGELTSWSDAKGQNFSQTYDELSRPRIRTEPDLTTEFIYGNSAASHNIGSVLSVTAGGYGESFTYDNAGRPSSRTITIPSDAPGTYTYDQTYSSTTGLLDTLTYPTSTSSYRLKLQYTYQNGILQKVADFNAPTTAFWTANTTNGRGQITKETLGNGVVTNRAFDAVTGWMSQETSGVGGAVDLQNVSYLFDRVGNVTERQNNNIFLTEDFHYDNVYRLKYSTLGGTTNLSLTYDATGNILTKSDLPAPAGTWQYDPTHKHAVTRAGGAGSTLTYSYDNNGNVISRHGFTVQWTSYNHPSLINGSAGQIISFDYNHNHERWRSVLNSSAGSETTYFIGDALEKVVTAGLVDYRHFIEAGGIRVAIVSRPTVGTAMTTRYVREDHLGSVENILNSNGTSFVKTSFGAFGERRSSCTWTGALTQGEKDRINSVTRHGYTWHTALAEMGLNDMNGRIQDAVSGRFLSPDPFVSDPTNTQSFNRYSYVMNNPLTFTDPTGYLMGFGPLDGAGGGFFAWFSYYSGPSPESMEWMASDLRMQAPGEGGPTPTFLPVSQSPTTTPVPSDSPTVPSDTPTVPSDSPPSKPVQPQPSTPQPPSYPGLPVGVEPGHERGVVGDPVIDTFVALLDFTDPPPNCPAYMQCMKGQVSPVAGLSAIRQGAKETSVFRSMRDAGGGPATGPSARTLGVRPGKDIPVDSKGMVRPGTGGMSVSPSPSSLPPSRRPASLGGTGKDPVWGIRTEDLGPRLRYVPDSPTHGTIQPSGVMSVEEFQNALCATAGCWRLE